MSVRDRVGAQVSGAGASASAIHFARLDQALAWASEVPAAFLVALEIIVLLAGVVSRYVFRNPLVWTDELASALFLWLAMLGAVIALRREEHMRLTTFLNRAPARWRSWLEAVGAMVVAAFVLLIIAPARSYIENEWAILTPALEFHNSFRVAAIGVGALMMMAIALLRLVERVPPREAAGALAAVALIAAAFWLARPALLGLGQANLLIFFVGLVALCVAIGVPIAFAFGTATVAYLALATHVPLTVLVGRMDEGMSHIILLAVPLFVFLGGLIEATGLARAMVDFLAALLGHVRGGLAYVLLGAMYLVSGISGSKA
ncbi:MAG: TRAP transporter small permease subunit, partial [Alphaproteobacteria bacterium]|nr:TRAP transporter small permease subunit [Alphaproteobacteria bacterium]